jgi:exopolyphosphatase / guanosine-5'-triphosphate,3'-diphosphate pyrophosphatase
MAQEFYQNHRMEPQNNPHLMAVLDLGTNTFNLLIRDNHADKTLFNTKIPVKLGAGGLANNIITTEAYQRGLNAVITHVKTAQDFGVTRFLAFATSGIRSTKNGAALAAEITLATGIHIHVIDGLQEADLIYEGICGAVPEGLRQHALVMDIGGGSTEFVLIEHGQKTWAMSYPLGASRIMEFIQPEDPLSEANLAALHARLQNETAALQEVIMRAKPPTLIGSSGSFDTMYDVIAGKTQVSMLNGDAMQPFDVEALKVLCDELIRKPLAQRLAMPGMVPMRADMIPISAAMLLWLFNIQAFDHVILSTWSLKEGVFATLKKHPELWRVSSL